MRCEQSFLLSLSALFHISTAVSCLDSIKRSSCSASSNFQSSKKDWALVGHVTEACVVRDELQCSHKCLSRNNCQSYNYEHTPGNEWHLCELNEKRKEQNPLEFRPKDGYTYYEPAGKTESGCLCQNGGECTDANGATCKLEERFTCKCPVDFKGRYCDTVSANNCDELKRLGANASGEYAIDPEGLGRVLVYCDQITDGGGWTVVQRRFTPYQTDFKRGWVDYQKGFGDVSGEHWLGNDVIHRLTKSPRALRIELKANDSHTGFALYGIFNISDSGDRYRLNVDRYSGTAGNSLYGFSYTWHNENKMQFTTLDQDNDHWARGTCGAGSGWWFNFCGKAHLNYHAVPKWDEWADHEGITFSEMKIR